MGTGCFINFLKRFFLSTAFICALSGCGSSGSPTNSGTGSFAANLTWKTPKSIAAKTLYAAPQDVTDIKISVYSDASMTDLITWKAFKATDGSGSIDAIPAGNGRAVKVEGLGTHSGSTGVLIYLGTATVDIVAGQTTQKQILMESPVTTASPATQTAGTRFEVTLTTSVPATVFYTTNEPATIYYTTNGDIPTTSSPNGTSPVRNIWIDPGSQVTLRFFAVVKGLYEAVKTVMYNTPP